MKASDLIRAARRRAGFTQSELAARTDTTQSAIARWEKGGVEPSLATLTRLVRACRMELRVELIDADPGESSLIERNLNLTPTERLDQLVRTVNFIRAGRAALRERDG